MRFRKNLTSVCSSACLIQFSVNSLHCLCLAQCNCDAWLKVPGDASVFTCIIIVHSKISSSPQQKSMTSGSIIPQLEIFIERSICSPFMATQECTVPIIATSNASLNASTNWVQMLILSKPWLHFVVSRPTAGAFPIYNCCICSDGCSCPFVVWIRFGRRLPFVSLPRTMLYVTNKQCKKCEKKERGTSRLLLHFSTQS